VSFQRILGAWLLATAVPSVGLSGSVYADVEESLNVSASSVDAASSPGGAIDASRFSTSPQQVWRGRPGAGHWWWQVEFAQPRLVGSIMQVIGAASDVLSDAPRDSVWQYSPDGRSWVDLPETRVQNERRLYRIHRLNDEVQTLGLRLVVSAVQGEAPVLREVEWASLIDHDYQFPDWVVAVSTAEATEGPGGLAAGGEFLPLVRSCPGWERTPAQFLWMGQFDPEFVNVEPRPLCAFLSGNFKDWCEKDRLPWKGIERLLHSAELPLWGACGGAQGLAILAEVGTDKPWDCPFCRDPGNPKSPIYGHIRHLKPGKCGDYSGCLFERGKFTVRQRRLDPVFAGLPRDFEIMESHCGQIEYVPKGWRHVVENGPDGHTRLQCLRREDRPIYAAQFHIEMEGTPENSRRIMDNFLKLSVIWRDTVMLPPELDTTGSTPAGPDS